MLYLEDYLELIEHLPQELLDRFIDIRERDLQVHNSSEQLKEKVKQFFADAKKLKPEQRQCEFEKLIKEYDDTARYADEKVQISTHMHEIMIKLVQRLDTELEKFKLELEADHAGITEELERRSLELDVAETLQHDNDNNRTLVNKDRRRSEHRHHPYQNNSDNGYSYQQNHGRAKLSNHEHHNRHQNHNHAHNRYHNQHLHGSKYRHHTSSAASSRQHSAATSPAPMVGFGLNGGVNLNSNKQSSVAGDSHEHEQLAGHYDATLFNSNNIINHSSGFTNSHHSTNINNKNDTLNQQHSALSAALASPPVSTFAMMNNSTSVHNKISTSNNLKSNDPLVTAASQAIAATQQLHQGRRTPSLKASFAAINAAGLAQQLDPSTGTNKLDGSQRNALAPMAPDQQAFRYGSQFVKNQQQQQLQPQSQHQQQQQQQQPQQQQANGNSNPLYISVTKSGRPTKRPRHHASHLYPDESPTSISSDNSVFENNESLSSADFIETGTNFGSNSPSSIDFASARNNTAFYHGDDTKYCICRQISYGEMVACDNNECEIEWFHYDCVGVSQPPKGKWYCPDCLKKMAKNQQHQDSQQAHITQKKRGRKEKDQHYLKDD